MIATSNSDNIGLVLVCLPSECTDVALSPSQYMTQLSGSLSCLLYFLCMLAIPIFPFLKFTRIFSLLVNLRRGNIGIHNPGYIFLWEGEIPKYNVGMGLWYQLPSLPQFSAQYHLYIPLHLECFVHVVYENECCVYRVFPALTRLLHRKVILL